MAETVTAGASIFFPSPKTVLPQFGPDDEKRLSKMLSEPLMSSTKFRACTILFPISLIILAPVVLVHTNGYRLRYFYNDTDNIGTNFYGFSVQEGKVLYSLPTAAGIFMVYIIHRLSFPMFCEKGKIVDIYFGGNFIFVLFVLPLALLGTQGFKENEFGMSLFTSPCCALAIVRPVLLTMLQEFFPEKSRPLATALYCAADTVLNCCLYFSVEIIIIDRWSELKDEKLTDWSAYMEHFLIILFAVAMKLHFQKYPESPYACVNFGYTKEQQADAFKFYWGINTEKVPRDLKEQLKVAKVNNDPEKSNFLQLDKMSFIRFSCCILQLPVTVVLCNAGSLLRLFGCSNVHVETYANALYISYTLFSVLSLFCIELLSVKRAVICTSGFTFLLFLFSTLSAASLQNNLQFSDFFNATTYFGILLVVISVNSLFLIPATWVIVGDISNGRQRPGIFIFVVLCNGVMVFLCQTVLEFYGWWSLCSLVTSLYAISLGLLWKLYDVEEDFSEEEDQLFFIRV